MAEVKTYLEALTALDDTPLTVAPGEVALRRRRPGPRHVRRPHGDRGPDDRQQPPRDRRPGRHPRRARPGRSGPAQRRRRRRACCTLVRVDQDASTTSSRRVPGLALEVMRVMARRLRKSNPEGADDPRTPGGSGCGSAPGTPPASAAGRGTPRACRR